MTMMIALEMDTNFDWQNKVEEDSWFYLKTNQEGWKSDECMRATGFLVHSIGKSDTESYTGLNHEDTIFSDSCRW